MAVFQQTGSLANWSLVPALRKVGARSFTEREIKPALSLNLGLLRAIMAAKPRGNVCTF